MAVCLVLPTRLIASRGQEGQTMRVIGQHLRPAHGQVAALVLALRRD